MNIMKVNSSIFKLISWKMPFFFAKNLPFSNSLRFLFSYKKNFFIRKTSSIELFFYNQQYLLSTKFTKRGSNFEISKKSSFYGFSKYKIIGFSFFNKNFINLKVILFNAFYYNFFLIGLKESSFSRDLISVNYNSTYFDYSDILSFFKLKSWIAIERYWRFKLYSNPNTVVLAADNHLLNHLNKSHFFIIDFLSNNINITSNSFTIFISIRDSFFSSFFFNFVYRYKIVGLNFRFFKYIAFCSSKNLIC